MNHFQKAWVPCFNTLDPWNPEFWAREALRLLYANTVALNVVHRDFSNQIQSEGDIVNATRPGKFKTIRKTATDDVRDQAATATKVPVKLDQHLHTTFIVKDEEMSKSLTDLVTQYLSPALESISQTIDQLILYQAYEFIENSVGRLGTKADKSLVVAAMTEANKMNLPQRNRWLIVPPQMHGDLMDDGTFHNADQLGDDGTAMREGSLGRKFTFNSVMSQNAPSLLQSDTEEDTSFGSGLINNANGYKKGDTVLTVDGFTGNVTLGLWCKIAGDDTPQMIVAESGTSASTSITVWPGLKRDVADNAAITVQKNALVNKAAGYAAGYGKVVDIDNVTKTPLAGQLISTGVTSANKRYGILPSETLAAGNATPSTTEIHLNRPLDVGVSDNDVLGLGPGGEYGLVLHPEAIAFVNRPLVLPNQDMGARAMVMNWRGLSVRVVMSYDSKAQGIRVTVDLLCGVKTLETGLGMLVYA